MECRYQLQQLDSEVQYNDQIIEERENEIFVIEQGITELNEIFRDLGTIVGEQQNLLGNKRVLFCVAKHLHIDNCASPD